MQRYCDWELCTSVAWLKIALPFLSAEHYLSSSNYMDCISSLTGSNGCNLKSLFKGTDLPELFSKLGLGKYTDVFQQQEVSILLQGIFVLIVCFTTVVLFLNQRCVISWISSQLSMGTISSCTFWFIQKIELISFSSFQVSFKPWLLLVN